MELYRLLFKSVSCFSTKIESYTLFGAFCWGYKKLFGEQKFLEDVLERFKTDPPFLISSPVVYSEDTLYFPVPQMKDDFDEPANEKEYKDQKKFKKLQWIPKEILIEFLNGKIKTKKELMPWFNNKNILKPSDSLIQRINTLHNSINRLTWTTTEGTLYNVTSYYYPNFGIYIILRDKSFDLEVLPRVFELVPLGGNKSIGWGRVKVVENQIERDKELENFISSDNPNKFYSFSPTFIDDAYKLEESFYQVNIFSGKLENFYERLVRPILKKRVIYLGSGSQLAIKKIKNTYGGLLSVLEAPSLTGGVKYTIYQYGYAFPLYLKETS